MKGLIDKILERLEELHERYINQYGVIGGNPMAFSVKECIEIVKQEAEKFGTDTNVGSNGWIACSERLPEENQKVILQDFYGNITIEKMEIRDGMEGFTDGDWWSSANNYVAWQPLPDPFKN